MEKIYHTLIGLMLLFSGGCINSIAQCANQGVIYSILPNADFEEYSQLPDGQQQLPRAIGWSQATGSTTDYISIYNNIGLTILNGITPPNGSELFAGIRIRRKEYNEYLGNCLSEPLLQGQSYEISMDVGASFGGTGVADGGFEGTLIVLGLPTCPTWPVTNDPDSQDDKYDVLAEEQVTIAPGQWINGGVTFEFTPSANYQAIMIGGYSSVNQERYVVVDGISVTLSGDESFLNQLGDICNGGVTLTAETPPSGATYTYQWYRDGVALIGEDQLTLQVGEAENGVYTFEITKDSNSCQLLGPVDLECIEIVANDNSYNLLDCGGVPTVNGNLITDDTGNGADSCSNGCDFELTQFTVAGGATVYTAGQTATLANVGTLTIDAQGNFTFVPLAGFNGNMPEVSYTIANQPPVDLTANASLNIEVVQCPLVANDNDYVMTTAESQLLGNVLVDNTGSGIDECTSGCNFQLSTFTIDGNPTTYLAGDTANLQNIGQLTLDAMGNLVYDLQTGFLGNLPLITYTITATVQGQTITANAVVGISIQNSDPSTCGSCDPYNLLNNADFECNNGNAVGISKMFTVDDWHQGTEEGTSDYHNMPSFTNYFYTSQLPPPPNGSSYFTGFIVAPSSDYYEYVATCLDQPILPNTDYRISMDVGAGLRLHHNNTYTGFDGTLVVLGVPNCPIWPIPGSGPDSFGEIHTQYDVLASAAVNIPVDTWLQDPLVMNFNVPQGYEAIIIGGYANGGNHYIVLDDVRLNEGQEPGYTLTGDICNGTVTLEANAPVTGGNNTFQWFRDGTAIPGETALVIDIDQNETGNYYLEISNNGVFCDRLDALTVDCSELSAFHDTYAISTCETEIVGNVLTDDTGNGVDSCSNGCDFELTEFSVAGDTSVYTPGQTANMTNVGTLTIDAQGNFTFVPETGFSGSIPEVTYTISNQPTCTPPAQGGYDAVVYDAGNNADVDFLQNLTNLSNFENQSTFSPVATFRYEELMNTENALGFRFDVRDPENFTQTYRDANTNDPDFSNFVATNGDGINPIGDRYAVIFSHTIQAGEAGNYNIDGQQIDNLGAIYLNDVQIFYENFYLNSNYVNELNIDLEEGDLLQLVVIERDNRNTTIDFNFNRLTDATNKPIVSNCTSNNPVVTQTASATLNIDIVPTPSLQNPGNIEECNTYTLPNLTVGNYYSSSGGQNPITNLNLTVSQEVYIYVENPSEPSCFNEVNFQVTIDSSGAQCGDLVANNNSVTVPDCISLITGNVITDDSGSGIDTCSSACAFELTQFMVAGDVTVYTAGQTATLANVGTLTLKANGDYTFEPYLDFSGSIPEVTYTISNQPSCTLPIIGGYNAVVYDAPETANVNFLSNLTNLSEFYNNNSEFVEVATFQYDELQGTDNGLGFRFEALNELYLTEPYQNNNNDPNITNFVATTGNGVELDNDKYAIAFSRTITENEAGIYEIAVQTVDNFGGLYLNDQQVYYTDYVSDGRFVNVTTLTLKIGDVLEFLLIEEDDIFTRLEMNFERVADQDGNPIGAICRSNNPPVAQTANATLNIDVVQTPILQNPGAIEECDSFTLPNLTAGNYYANSGGQDLITDLTLTASQEVFIYVENPLDPSCYNEEAFEVTINETPTATLQSTICSADLTKYTAVFDNLNGATLAFFTDGTVNGDRVENIPAGSDIQVTVSNGTCEQIINITAPDCSCPSIAAPSLTADQIICEGNTPTVFTATLPNGGNQIRWYENESDTTPVFEGAAFTSMQTSVGDYDFYAEAVDTQSGCASPRTRVNLTINPLPNVDTMADVNACDSYVLPALTQGNYFTETNGGGTPLFAGDEILNSDTIYIFYDQNGCTAESFFEVNILDNASFDNLDDQDLCGIFTIPSLPNGAFYTEPMGRGRELLVGEEITETQILYAFYSNGVCEQEKAIKVNIYNPPIALNPGNQTACEEYILPVLENGNYFTQPNGKGEMLSGGDKVYTSTTLFVLTQNDSLASCTDETSFEIKIIPIPEIPPLENGILCIGNEGKAENPIVLGIDLGPDVIYDWTPDNDPDGDGIENALFEVEKAGEYSLQLFTSIEADKGLNCTSGIVYKSNISATYSPTGIDTAVEVDSYKLYGGNRAIIEASFATGGQPEFEYTLDGINMEWQDSPVFNDLEGGVYTAYVRSKTGCGEVLESQPFLIVNYPTFFSPNGDNQNESWNIIAPRDAKLVQNLVIHVFDRYGRLIKEMRAGESNWDGTLNGKLLPSTDYWFKAYLEDQTSGESAPIEFSGHFSLVR